MDGLFCPKEVKKRCTCLEKVKPLEKRNLTIRTYYARNIWGKAKNYDGRKLLEVHCNVCGCAWKDYNKNSKIWKLINDSPYEGHENIYRRNDNE